MGRSRFAEGSGGAKKGTGLGLTFGVVGFLTERQVVACNRFVGGCQVLSRHSDYCRDTCLDRFLASAACVVVPTPARSASRDAAYCKLAMIEVRLIILGSPEILVGLGGDCRSQRPL